MAKKKTKKAPVAPKVTPIIKESSPLIIQPPVYQKDMSTGIDEDEKYYVPWQYVSDMPEPIFGRPITSLEEQPQVPVVDLGMPMSMPYNQKAAYEAQSATSPTAPPSPNGYIVRSNREAPDMYEAGVPPLLNQRIDPIVSPDYVTPTMPNIKLPSAAQASPMPTFQDRWNEFNKIPIQPGESIKANMPYGEDLNKDARELTNQINAGMILPMWQAIFDIAAKDVENVKARNQSAVEYNKGLLDHPLTYNEPGRSRRAWGLNTSGVPEMLVPYETPKPPKFEGLPNFQVPPEPKYAVAEMARGKDFKPAAQSNKNQPYLDLMVTYLDPNNIPNTNRIGTGGSFSFPMLKKAVMEGYKASFATNDVLAPTYNDLFKKDIWMEPNTWVVPDSKGNDNQYKNMRWWEAMEQMVAEDLAKGTNGRLYANGFTDKYNATKLNTDRLWRRDRNQAIINDPAANADLLAVFKGFAKTLWDKNKGWYKSSYNRNPGGDPQRVDRPDTFFDQYGPDFMSLLALAKYKGYARGQF